MWRRRRWVSQVVEGDDGVSAIILCTVNMRRQCGGLLGMLEVPVDDGTLLCVAYMDPVYNTT